MSVLDSTGEGTAGSTTSDRAKLTAHLKTNAEKFFEQEDDTAPVNYSVQIDAFYSNKTSSSTAYSLLSNGYNAADQVIGSQLDFVMLKMTASSG